MIVAITGLFRTVSLAGLLIAATTYIAVGDPLTVEIVSVGAAYDHRTNEPIITFKMSETSKRQFGDLTQKYAGKKIDGRILMAPVIREPIPGGSGRISSNFTAGRAKELAERMAAGKANVEFEIVND